MPIGTPGVRLTLFDLTRQELIRNRRTTVLLEQPNAVINSSFVLKFPFHGACFSLLLIERMTTKCVLVKALGDTGISLWIRQEPHYA